MGRRRTLTQSALIKKRKFYV